MLCSRCQLLCDDAHERCDASASPHDCTSHDNSNANVQHEPNASRANAGCTNPSRSDSRSPQAKRLVLLGWSISLMAKIEGVVNHFSMVYDTFFCCCNRPQRIVLRMVPCSCQNWTSCRMISNMTMPNESDTNCVRSAATSPPSRLRSHKPFPSLLDNLPAVRARVPCGVHPHALHPRWVEG